jgi:uncharacterized protein (TIGR03118 family)
MNYLPYRLRSRALYRSALPCLPVLVLLLLFCLPSLLPGSSAARKGNLSRSDGAQAQPAFTFVASYHQTNLVSNAPGVAFVEDPSLQNPWGLALNSNSPFWVVNNNSDSANLYNGAVAGSPLVPNSALPAVAIPNAPIAAPSPSQPTGIVANTTNDFIVSLTPTSPAAPAQFIFATLQGGINAWQPGLGAVAVSVRYDGTQDLVPGSSYTGLAIGNNAGANFLYVADFARGNINVFDKDFKTISVGNFADSTIPANFHPHNIQNIGGALYVTYAEAFHGPNSGFDLGFVRKFDTNGVRDPAFAINNGPLNSPWGMALAPASFGGFSNTLLVGNNSFGNGFTSPMISAFNPATGAWIGYMVDGGGGVLRIDNLRALTFGNGVNGGDPNTLYFSAGSSINYFGLFGSLTPVTGNPSTIKFSDLEYHASENGGHIDITVTRSGVTAGTATVNYATINGGGTQKSDYEIALGKLTFNPGESSKTFRVLIVDDHYLAGGSSADLKLILSNPTGAELTRPNQAYLYLMDDEGDTPGQPPNILDDNQFFVRQQYFDFLNREPDVAGFNFWLNQITSCGTDQECVSLRKTNVSAAFFLSIEFQSTGVLAYLTENAAFGKLPRYGPFMRDVQALQKDYVFGAPGAGAQLEANKQAFFNDFVLRPEFVAKFSGMTNAQYVDNLIQNTGVTFTQAERDSMVSGLNNMTETRATVLRRVAEKDSFKQREANRAFVLMEYFGYMRRNPDDPPDHDFSGYDFWLDKLNTFNGNFVTSDMVKAFRVSSEYRSRFGPP